MISPARSIRSRLMIVVLATTFFALLISGAIQLALEYGENREATANEMRAQAEMLGRATAAAIAFNVPKDATAALGALKENADILGAALYGTEGRLFTSFGPVPASVPGDAEAVGFSVDRDRVSGFQPIREAGNTLGYVYLSARYELYDRLMRSVSVLLGVMALALAGAAILSFRLQRSITRPILEVADTARVVMEHADYSVRAQHASLDETGVLAEAFNRMLEEVERRSTALRKEMRERQEAEAALKVADRRKDEFLATLAHELRNPLAPITSSVAILKLKAPANAEVAWASDVVERQVRHMARLLDDLLDVGRITANKLQLRKTRLEVKSVIEAGLETSRPLIEAAGHELEARLPEEPLWIEGDGVRLAQVVSNLLNNAAKYTERGGRISLEVEAAGADIVIRVRDNGIGISQEALPQVFDIFSQAMPTFDKSQGGLGIGLFLVRSFVEMHGGSVEARSEGAGKGSEFAVRLPRLPDANDAIAGPETGSGASAGLRILIADDNADAADSLATLLRIDGYDVSVAYDGVGAVEAAEEHRPQLALLDIGMPRLNGYQAAERIRAKEWGREVVLVALTGWGQDEDRRKALAAGFDHHITKPADAGRLRALLAGIGQAKARQRT